MRAREYAPCTCRPWRRTARRTRRRSTATESVAPRPQAHATETVASVRHARSVVHTHTHTHTLTYMHTPTHIHTRARTDTQTRAHEHTHTHARAHTHRRARARTQIHAQRVAGFRREGPRAATWVCRAHLVHVYALRRNAALPCTDDPQIDEQPSRLRSVCACACVCEHASLLRCLRSGTSQRRLRRRSPSGLTASKQANGGMVRVRTSAPRVCRQARQ